LVLGLPLQQDFPGERNKKSQRAVLKLSVVFIWNFNDSGFEKFAENKLKERHHLESVQQMSLSMEQSILDTNAGKTSVLSCHRCLINSGIEKMNNI
jgi:hypothetical protein